MPMYLSFGPTSEGYQQLKLSTRRMKFNWRIMRATTSAQGKISLWIKRALILVGVIGALTILLTTKSLNSRPSGYQDALNVSGELVDLQDPIAGESFVDDDTEIENTAEEEVEEEGGVINDTRDESVIRPDVVSVTEGKEDEDQVEEGLTTQPAQLEVARMVSTSGPVVPLGNVQEQVQSNGSMAKVEPQEAPSNQGPTWVLKSNMATFNYPEFSNCQEANYIEYDGYPLTAMAAIRGSGEEWVRYLLQQATGKENKQIDLDISRH